MYSHRLELSHCQSKRGNKKEGQKRIEILKGNRTREKINIKEDDRRGGMGRIAAKLVLCKIKFRRQKFRAKLALQRPTFEEFLHGP
jgi:hypothetical protein